MVMPGGPRRIERPGVGFTADNSPKLIPKIIHQTYKSTHLPDSVKPYMQTWRRENEDWEIRFYDDAACLSFVQREFPEYVEAYKALPKDVERSDFFRWGPAPALPAMPHPVCCCLELGGQQADPSVLRLKTCLNLWLCCRFQSLPLSSGNKLACYTLAPSLGTGSAAHMHVPSSPAISGW